MYKDFKVFTLVLRRLSIGDRKHPLDHLFGPNRDQSKIDVFRLRNRSRCFRSRHGTKNSPLKSSQENAAWPSVKIKKEEKSDAPCNNNKTLNTTANHMDSLW